MTDAASGRLLPGLPKRRLSGGQRPPRRSRKHARAAGGSRPGSRQPDAAGLGRAIVKRRRVLIIGAGFAGFHCARQLERKLEAHEAEVALVTPRNYLICSPLLPQVAAGLLSPVPLE